MFDVKILVFSNDVTRCFLLNNKYIKSAKQNAKYEFF